MYSYYKARKELSNLFWNFMIDGTDLLIMEHILLCYSEEV